MKLENIHKQKIRDYLTEALNNQGDKQPLTDTDSLFVSGRLDSVSMMMLVVYLEEEFAVNFKATDFEVALIDSIDAIALLIDSQVSA
ncbi:MAG: acyl carrier protein [Betaproteobacteria bacterium]|nr:acyl carrier protein [Betaproteobacteria bacterium]NDF04859.1 acyl carrier protein [Betaproteobacteria bacterium]